MDLTLNFIHIIDEVEYEPQLFLMMKLPSISDDVGLRAVCRPSWLRVSEWNSSAHVHQD